MSVLDDPQIAILNVPGLNNSGPAHWQTRWERNHGAIGRAELGLWDDPRRNAWVTSLDHAIRAASRPVVLVAHSLGCLAVAWWAVLEGQSKGWPVAGALLVAPPDLEVLGDVRVAGDFNPRPRVLMPFPTILVASRDDPWATMTVQRDMARDWGSHLVDAGQQGHLNAESGMVDWAEGKALLTRLVEVARGEASASVLEAAQSIHDGRAALKVFPGREGLGQSLPLS
jgi:predicted alpha/beta hydrolase family esterase